MAFQRNEFDVYLASPCESIDRPLVVPRGVLFGLRASSRPDSGSHPLLRVLRFHWPSDTPVHLYVNRERWTRCTTTRCSLKALTDSLVHSVLKSGRAVGDTHITSQTA